MLVIITGTINPNKNVPYLVLKDKDERLIQYKNSLRKIILCKNISRVIFCDNSNTNIDEKEFNDLAEKYGKQFEFIKFQGDNQKVVSHGKGYGEGEIIKYILEKSNLINDNDYFIKITGRLYVENLEKIVNSINRKYMYINTDLKNKSGMADTRIYGISVNIYKEYFKDLYKSVDDKNKIYLEHLFYKQIKEKKILSKNFEYYPIISGQSGSMGIMYKNNKLKNQFKNILSRMGMFSIR